MPCGFKLLQNNTSTICYTQLYHCVYLSKGYNGDNELIALKIDAYKKVLVAIHADLQYMFVLQGGEDVETKR